MRLFSPLLADLTVLGSVVALMAKANTYYGENDFGIGYISVTYVDEIDPSIHLVKDYDSMREGMTRTEEVWEVSCAGGGHYRWTGDAKNPDGWDE